MNRMRFLFLLVFLSQYFSLTAAKVDSIDIASAVMHKTYKAAVILPDSYAKNKLAYPVLYLLHGGGGRFSDWLTSTPDKMTVKNLADQYNLVIVLPEGQPFSWYLNSTVDKESQFETYITEEVISRIDQVYRTVADKKGRAITGLSMGGHGAMYLSARHPDLFCAAGSMSGALDLNVANWKIPAEFNRDVKQRFQKMVGDTNNIALYDASSVVNMADKIKANKLALVIDCGVDDFLIEPNRELHRRLVYNHTPHDYTERPGGHTWDYWQNSLPNHVLFLPRSLKRTGWLCFHDPCMNDQAMDQLFHRLTTYINHSCLLLR